MEAKYDETCLSVTDENLIGHRICELDRERRDVLMLILEFTTAIQTPGRASHALTILEQTIVTVAQHFLAEEALFEELRYWNAKPHRVKHQTILRELKEAYDRWIQTDTAAASAELAHAMDALLLHEVRDSHKFRYRSPDGSLKANGDRSAKRVQPV